MAASGLGNSARSHICFLHQLSPWAWKLPTSEKLTSRLYWFVSKWSNKPINSQPPPSLWIPAREDDCSCYKSCLGEEEKGPAPVGPSPGLLHLYGDLQGGISLSTWLIGKWGLEQAGDLTKASQLEKGSKCRAVFSDGEGKHSGSNEWSGRLPGPAMCSVSEEENYTVFAGLSRADKQDGQSGWPGWGQGPKLRRKTKHEAWNSQEVTMLTPCSCDHLQSSGHRIRTVSFGPPATVWGWWYHHPRSKEEERDWATVTQLGVERLGCEPIFWLQWIFFLGFGARETLLESFMRWPWVYAHLSRLHQLNYKIN